jgi:hypothetical protein
MHDGIFIDSVWDDNNTTFVRPRRANQTNHSVTLARLDCFSVERTRPSRLSYSMLRVVMAGCWVSSNHLHYSSASCALFIAAAGCYRCRYRCRCGYRSISHYRGPHHGSSHSSLHSLKANLIIPWPQIKISPTRPVRALRHNNQPHYLTFFVWSHAHSKPPGLLSTTHSLKRSVAIPSQAPWQQRKKNPRCVALSSIDSLYQALGDISSGLEEEGYISYSRYSVHSLENCNTRTILFFCWNLSEIWKPAGSVQTEKKTERVGKKFAHFSFTVRIQATRFFHNSRHRSFQDEDWDLRSVSAHAKNTIFLFFLRKQPKRSQRNTNIKIWI